MYAVVRTGGKQYRVEPGQRLKVEKLPGAVGDAVELSDVLLLATDEGVTVGAPAVADTRVLAEVAAQGRDRKLQVFKYKSKTRYRRLIGHRQHHTVLLIKEFNGPGIVPPKKGKEQAPAEEETPVLAVETAALASPEAEVETPVAAEAVVETSEPEATSDADEKPARKRPARATAAKKAATKAPAKKAATSATKRAPKGAPSAKKAAKPTAAKKAAKKAPARKRPAKGAPKDKGD